MASLSIRKLDNQVYEALRIRAAQHGVSMEEEARQALSQIIIPTVNIGSIFSRYFGKDNGVALSLEARASHDPMDFASKADLLRV